MPNEDIINIGTQDTVKFYSKNCECKPRNSFTKN